MSGVKKFSELSKEELVKRIANSCCYRCEIFQDVENCKGYWTCSYCDTTICCDSCAVWSEDIDQNEDKDNGFCCEECAKKEKEEEANK